MFNPDETAQRLRSAIALYRDVYWLNELAPAGVDSLDDALACAAMEVDSALLDWLSDTSDGSNSSSETAAQAVEGSK